MSTTVKNGDTLMKVTVIKVEKSDSENMGKAPLDTWELDIKNEPIDESKAIKSDIQIHILPDLFQKDLRKILQLLMKQRKKVSS